MDLGLKGKSVVVTGGSKGIGFAAAEAFLKEGAPGSIPVHEKAAFRRHRQCKLPGSTLLLRRKKHAVRPVKVSDQQPD